MNATQRKQIAKRFNKAQSSEALFAIAKAAGVMPGYVSKDDAIDLITSILHHLDEEERDVCDCVASAIQHFEAEKLKAEKDIEDYMARVEIYVDGILMGDA
jgi:hypothetical protein